MGDAGLLGLSSFLGSAADAYQKAPERKLARMNAQREMDEQDPNSDTSRKAREATRGLLNEQAPGKAATEGTPETPAVPEMPAVPEQKSMHQGIPNAPGLLQNISTEDNQGTSGTFDVTPGKAAVPGRSAIAGTPGEAAKPGLGDRLIGENMSARDIKEQVKDGLLKSYQGGEFGLMGKQAMLNNTNYWKNLGQQNTEERLKNSQRGTAIKEANLSSRIQGQVTGDPLVQQMEMGHQRNLRALDLLKDPNMTPQELSTTIMEQENAVAGGMAALGNVERGLYSPYESRWGKVMQDLTGSVGQNQTVPTQVRERIYNKIMQLDQNMTTAKYQRMQFRAPNIQGFPSIQNAVNQKVQSSNPSNGPAPSAPAQKAPSFDPDAYLGTKK